MSIKKNDLVELKIVDVTLDGSGIGKSDGMAVFVPNSAVGDIIKVKILKVKRNYAFAKIEEYIKKSVDRIDIDCENSGKCGGCTFRHINYEAELKLKESRVKEVIERIGGIKDLKIEKIIGSERINNYRNKAQLPICKNKYGLYELGFFAPHSHRVVECRHCLLHPEVFNNIINVFKSWAEKVKISVYDERTRKGVLRHLYLRLAEATGEIMVCVVANATSLTGEELLVKGLRECSKDVKSIVLNSNFDATNVILGQNNRVIWGKPYITDIMCSLNFNISPNSFYQINKSQAERLYSIARKYAGLKKDEVLLDLYCGTGTIGLTMAMDCKKLIGVEIVKQAVKNANENARINHITNVDFICADALKSAETLVKKGELPDVVVIDPPRKGCSEELINIITEKILPKRVVYVSCDPATLARDLKIFKIKNFKPLMLTPVDMFPRTSHVECVVLMSRVED